MVGNLLINKYKGTVRKNVALKWKKTSLEEYQ